VQAAIAALHDEAARFQDTDWRQILALYEWLEHLAPGPMVTLNRLVALAMVDGPQSALPQLDALEDHYRVDAVRAHLLDLAGDHEAAREHYRRAAERTLSLPERRYLQARI
jgi:predicted RNA polymerase sigma factor